MAKSPPPAPAPETPTFSVAEARRDPSSQAFPSENRDISNLFSCIVSRMRTAQQRKATRSKSSLQSHLLYLVSQSHTYCFFLRAENVSNQQEKKRKENTHIHTIDINERKKQHNFFNTSQNGENNKLSRKTTEQKTTTATTTTTCHLNEPNLYSQISHK